MKTPATKFFLIATVVLFALSGMEGDTSFFCQQRAQAQNGQGNLFVEITVMADEHINKEQGSSQKEETPAFKFPNVFDALRLIF